MAGFLTGGSKLAHGPCGVEPSVGCQFATPAGEMVCAPLPEIVNARIWARCCVCVTPNHLTEPVGLRPDYLRG